eukprot:COSAG02_NODE_5497_length_4280_cov_7.072232_6_plen_55_part_00
MILKKQDLLKICREFPFHHTHKFERQNKSTQNPVLRTLGPGSGVAKAETELERQ